MNPIPQVEAAVPARNIVISAGIIAIVAACVKNPSGPGATASCGAQATQLSLAVAAYASVNPATDSGCVTFAANSSSDTIEYLVLPWSAGGTLGSLTPYALASAAPLTATPNLEASQFMGARRPRDARGPAANAFDHFLRDLARSRQYGLPAQAARAAGADFPRSPAAPPAVGDKRTFKVCSKSDCSTFDPVGAVARTVGAHVAIYVDTLAPTPGVGQAALDSVASLFDSQLYPADTATFGGVSDIDGNSVVIVLMTRTVNKLVTKADCNAEGFVAGFFFAGDIDPTFATQFNNGEIFYSIVADSSATLSCAHPVSELDRILPVTFVHEFQHMISFVQHVRIRGGNSEDTWLDEGMSRYAEENAGRVLRAAGDSAAFSRFAIDPIFDAYQYMRVPETSALLFARDTGGLAPLGAGWLFVRYLVDQLGDSLPRRLVESNQTGQANVAARAGQSIDLLISRWALANWVSDLPGFSAPPELQYTSWHFRTTFASLSSQDPADFPVPFPLVPHVSASSGVDLMGTLRAGTGAYVRVMQRPGGAAFSLQFSDPNGAMLPSTVVPRLNVVRIR
jgi:hypothetical protein